MKPKTVVAFSLVAIIILLVGLLIASKSLYFEKRINACFLLVEGWVPSNIMKEALVEFQNENYELILTTGGPFENQISINSNSFLIFVPKAEVKVNQMPEMIHSFLFEVKSSLGPTDSAHFVFWINDKAIEDFYSTGPTGQFSVTWQGELNLIDSIMIQFTNDAFIEGKDRNLFVNYLIVNEIALNPKNSLIFLDFAPPFGVDRVNLSATNYAGLASVFFSDSGVPIEKIIAIPSTKGGMFRTLRSAFSVKDWIKANNLTDVKINIITTRYHSRRTWLVFNKVLGGLAEVGVIPSSESIEVVEQKNETKVRIRESAALLFYFIFVIPFV